MSDAGPEPLCRFWRVTEAGPPPRRADRSAGGTLPTRAFRYCEAATTAAGFGWLVFPPIDLAMVWDGSEIRWTWQGADGWHPLTVAQFPGFRDRFDAAAPEALRSWSPPFAGALPEPGLVNLWSGLFARSRPGWSLLLRPPANLPRPAGYEIYEGMVEADRWFGPLFVNLRLTRTHAPVEFRRDMPLFQVQPVPREAYREASLAAFAVEDGLAAFGPAEWEAYDRSIVAPRREGGCPLGRDAAAIRRRRRGEPA
ncbi:hypothetical protein GXW74_21210 [Roseomonas eburnea]|uniref:Uncharacterized protein n=1 Tax=Neoroseomonas eburnea TaxID=1346889 RepID=A0A9X9XH39_9PROT|nr:DUF6065 family protein [Neoroseomonas eburnea]MBR0683025.1 hypothetical protein [Neoroseomonas eburnea]